MDEQTILARFREFSALTGEALTDCRTLCRDAARELRERYQEEEAGTELFCSASAALAYYRYCLAAYSGSALSRLGEAALVNEKTLAAAKALSEEYLSALAPFLRSARFQFKQVKP